MTTELSPMMVFKTQFEEAVSEMPLTADVTSEMLYSAAVVAVTKDPELLYADRASLFQSLRQCAADGLVPDGREAHLQIYSTKTKIDGRYTWIKKVQYNAMVWGITKRVLNSGNIINFWAEVVYEGESYAIEYRDGQRHPVHQYDPMNRGDKIIGAYAVALNTAGAVELETLDAGDLERIRSVAKTQNVWSNWAGEKSKVASMRRLSKRLRLSSEDRGLVAGHDTDFSKLIAPFKNAPRLEAPKSYTQRLAAKNAQGGEQAPEGDSHAEKQLEAPSEPESDAFAGSDDFIAGSNCQRDGIAFADCPHEIGTQEATDWMAGWKGMEKAGASE